MPPGAVRLCCLLVSQQALLLGMLKFGAAVRHHDFRYWWVFPLGLVVLTATFALVSRVKPICRHAC